MPTRGMKLGAIGLMLFAGALLSSTPPAAAAEIHIGGIDAETQYTGAGLPVGDAGILTFWDEFNANNDAELGVVDSEDLAGFDLIGGKVGFEAILSATGNTGNPFDPATTNVRRGRFEGTGGSEFTIYSPIDDNIMLLVFDLSFIDVTAGGPRLPARRPGRTDLPG